MLGKLMKYDMKNMGRKIAGAYVMLLVLSLLAVFADAVYDPSSQNTVTQLFYQTAKWAFYIGMAVTCLMAIVQSITYFKENLLRDEGYLMHTLPVSVGSLVASKFLSSVIWMGITLLVCCLCKAIADADLFWAARFGFGGRDWFFIGVIVVSLFLFYISMLCGGFMAYTLSYTLPAKSQNIRDACVVAVGVLVYFVNQSVTVLFAIASDDFSEAVLLAQTDAIFFKNVAPGIFSVAAVYLILAGSYTAITLRQMTKRLNLD